MKAELAVLSVSYTHLDVYKRQVLLIPNNIKSQLDKGIVPNLSGLSAKDVLFLLENSGFHVKLMGIGSVKKQSIEAGQKFNKGTKITLTLS